MLGTLILSYFHWAKLKDISLKKKNILFLWLLGSQYFLKNNKYRRQREREAYEIIAVIKQNDGIIETYSFLNRGIP